MILAVSATQSNNDKMFSIYIINCIGEIAQVVLRLLIKQRGLSLSLGQSYIFLHFLVNFSENTNLFAKMPRVLFFPLRVSFHQLYKYMHYRIDRESYEDLL